MGPQLLFHGLILLDERKYDFLGYSMSSLRNRSTWFCTKFNWYDEAGKVHEVDANFIRDDLGDFENVKRQPARYGARMAQAFTATDPSIVLQPHQISSIPDVERLYRGETACFTDGVGKISMGLTKQVWSRLHNGMEPAGILPSAFQVSQAFMDMCQRWLTQRVSFDWEGIRVC